MGITFGDYLIDSGYYDPEEEPMPVEDMRTQAECDERMRRAEKRGEICEALRIAQGSIIGAAVGACDCNTKTNNPAYHMAYCRWLKLMNALDHLDSVVEYLNMEQWQREGLVKLSLEPTGNYATITDAGRRLANKSMRRS